MIIIIQHEIPEEMPEEIQVQVAKRLLSANVGRYMQVDDPRISEGDEMLTLTSPIVGFFKASPDLAVELQKYIQDILDDITKNGPLRNEL